MSGLTIVAIPEKDDYVWKISSETIPHMTLLFLGVHEVGPQTAAVASYLEHATNTMLHRFGMSVDHRGTLGPLDADVLFFDKSFCGRELTEFRDALLKSPEILGLYNEAPQYEEWTPHLTLGYPNTPANEDTRDYSGINWVNFDKIALWVDDFEGPEIQLESHNTYLVEHKGTLRERALAHAGSQVYDAAARRERYLRERRLKGRSSAGLGPTNKHRTNAIARNAKAGLSQEKRREINQEALKVKAALSKLTDEFRSWVESHPKATPAEKAAQKTASVEQKNAIVAEFNIKVSKIAFASAEHDVMINGIDASVVAQVQDALQFGRIGMKWGVTHPRGADGRVTIGGRPTRMTRKQVRKAGVHSLSDEDLKKLTDRINLENNYAKAISDSSRTAAFNTKAKRVVDLGKNANDAVKFGNSAVGQALLKQIDPNLAAKVAAIADKSAAVTGDKKSKKKGKENPLKTIAKDLAPAVTGNHTPRSKLTGRKVRGGKHRA